MPDPIFMKLGMYVMAPEPISREHFINPSHQSVCLYMNPTVIARQWLGKNVTTAMNTQTTTEGLLDTSFSMQSVLYERKAGR
jgi:hypothetical protein